MTLIVNDGTTPDKKKFYKLVEMEWENGMVNVKQLVGEYSKSEIEAMYVNPKAQLEEYNEMLLAFK